MTKNFASVQSAQANHAKKICIHSNGSGAIRAKKFVIRSNGSGCLLKKIATVWKKLLTVWATGPLCSKINLSRFSISQNNFVASQSSRTRYSSVVMLQSLFTNASWIVTYLFLLLYSHLHFHYYHLIIGSIDTQFIQCLSFFHVNKFPKNNVLTFHRCMQTNNLRSKDMICPWENTRCRLVPSLLAFSR